MSIVFGSPEAQAILARDREQYKLLQQAREIAEQEGDGLADALAEVELGVSLMQSEVNDLDRLLDNCAPEIVQDVGEELEAAESELMAARNKRTLYRLALDIQKGKVQP